MPGAEVEAGQGLGTARAGATLVWLQPLDMVSISRPYPDGLFWSKSISRAYRVAYPCSICLRILVSGGIPDLDMAYPIAYQSESEKESMHRIHKILYFSMEFSIWM